MIVDSHGACVGYITHTRMWNRHAELWYTVKTQQSKWGPDISLGEVRKTWPNVAPSAVAGYGKTLTRDGICYTKERPGRRCTGVVI